MKNIQKSVKNIGLINTFKIKTRFRFIFNKIFWIRVLGNAFNVKYKNVYFFEKNQILLNPTNNGVFNIKLKPYLLNKSFKKINSNFYINLFLFM